MFLGYGVFLSVFCFSLQMRVSVILDKDGISLGFWIFE